MFFINLQCRSSDFLRNTVVPRFMYNKVVKTKTIKIYYSIIIEMTDTKPANSYGYFQCTYLL